MELTAGNLSRSRSSGRPQQLCAGSPVTGLSQKFPPDLRAPASKSLRLGWDFHTSAIFFRSAHAPYILYRPHAPQTIPTQSLRSILGGLMRLEAGWLSRSPPRRQGRTQSSPLAAAMRIGNHPVMHDVRMVYSPPLSPAPAVLANISRC
jgi:hypothetical protein